MRKHFPTGICCSLAASSPQRRSATGEKCRRSLMHLSSPAKADWHRDQSKGSNETWNMLNLLYLFMTLGRVMDGYECHFHYTAYWLPVSQTAPRNPSESKLPDSTWNTEQPARFFCFFFFCVSWPLAWNHTNFLNYSKLTAFCHFLSFDLLHFVADASKKHLFSSVITSSSQSVKCCFFLFACAHKTWGWLRCTRKRRTWGFINL